VKIDHDARSGSVAEDVADHYSLEARAVVKATNSIDADSLFIKVMDVAAGLFR